MTREMNRLLESLVADLTEASGKVLMNSAGDGFREVYGPGVYDSHLIDSTKNGKKVQAAAMAALRALKDKLAGMSSSEVFDAVGAEVKKATGKTLIWNTKSYPD